MISGINRSKLTQGPNCKKKRLIIVWLFIRVPSLIPNNLSRGYPAYQVGTAWDIVYSLAIGIIMQPASSSRIQLISLDCKDNGSWIQESGELGNWNSKSRPLRHFVRAWGIWTSIPTVHLCLHSHSQK